MDVNRSISKLVSFNCKSVIRSVDCVRKLCQSADIVALQETWLLPHDISFLGTIDDAFCYTGNSAVDTSAGIVRGRPYGGVALLWRKSVFSSVSVVVCRSVRLTAIKIVINNSSILVITVYMPTDSFENLTEFTECLSELNAIIESNDVETVFILGDFNAHPGELFSCELLSFCAEQMWSCVDMELLPPDAYTFISEAHGCRRWLDHCVVTGSARRLIENVSVLYDIYWSDHFPLLVECNLNVILPKKQIITSSLNKINWGSRNNKQIEAYLNYCNLELKQFDFPSECTRCADRMCDNEAHKLVISKMYERIVNVLTKAAESSCNKRVPNRRKHKQVAGWNRCVGDAHRRARICFQTWIYHGKPRTGPVFRDMCESRKIFKSKLKYCQDNEVQIKMNNIAEHHAKKKFSDFWKITKNLNPVTILPVSVGGAQESRDIACAFQRHFKVESPLGPASQVLAAEDRPREIAVRFSAKDVAAVIKKMIRGKSPGHDGLSIEHLKYAGVHLPRALALFFNLCVSHSYLPDELMFTVVVPIIKNKTGDSADIANYRPISLATVISKVLDSLLDQQLEKHLNLNDNQFGFRPGLSTESAILCLKQTVQYYTDRDTPVYACFLDISKAFDMVSYDKLWHKLRCETKLTHDVISLFEYWYNNQQNSIRWAGTHSDVYRLECGVRQGGLTSPRLFNLYMNQLIGELSSTKVGCSIDGVFINNISYADDMVLLSPSISALRKLLSCCESYAEAHGLRYNPKKSEYMIFKAGAKSYSTVPPVTLCGSLLNRVSRFKYLGHWVTDDLSDNADIERERRALSVRCNMLARRFARCSAQVKVTLFKAYCQTFYTCSLWTNYTQRAYSALRVQYNNAFRILLGRPRFCSASAMFAEARTDDFYSIIRKRSASLLRRGRDSSNGILSVLSERWDSPFLRRWLQLHASACAYYIL